MVASRRGKPAVRPRKRRAALAPARAAGTGLRQQLAEARAQQAATAEILKVIARSPADEQPVLDAIGRLAERLCKADVSVVSRFDGERLQLSALHGVAKGGIERVRRVFPMATDAETVSARAFRGGKVVHVADVLADRRYGAKGTARVGGWRGALGVPMLREGKVIGVIFVARFVPGLFSEAQVGLLSAFADQAVVAIENARLFNETREALERQTATAEILKVIAGSPSDVEPVFDAIVRNFVSLSGGLFGAVFRFDGSLVHFASAHGFTEEQSKAIRAKYPVAPDDPSVVSSRAILTRAPVVIEDIAQDRFYDREHAYVAGWRRIISVPMLREGVPLGAIVSAWTEPGPVPQPLQDLLKTFADQAVIAIENVRLFNETREALERQTATAEILNVIAGSPSSVQPVFDAIAKSAYRLLGGFSTAVARVFDDVLHLVAFSSTDEAGNEALKHAFPMPVSRSKAARTGEAVSIRDTEALPESASAMRDLARTRGFRSILIVPMLRDGAAIGTISVTRREPADFSTHQVDLLETFADQAVIAIENVRLFNETREALEQQRASADVLGAISGSITDTRPVFDKILERCEKLFEGNVVGITLATADGKIDLAAYHGRDHEKLKSVYPLPLSRESGSGAAILDATVAHYPDIEAAGVPPGVVAGCRTVGMRAIIFAPMLFEGRGIGAIWVGRTSAGTFTEKQIAVLRTFTDQAVIAIQNVRMFNETREALERQTATAEILKVISASPTDVQPVFEAIVASGMKLFSGAGVGIGIVKGEQIVIEAAAGMGGVGMGFRMPLSRDSASGMAILERKLVNIADTEAPGVPPHARENGRRLGIRSMTQAPMFREGEPIGSIGVMLKEPGGLDGNQLALLKTFADQAVIAIENVRLFNELQTQTAALKRSVGQLTALGEVGQAISSTLDLETVLQTIVSRAVQLTAMDGGTIYEFDEAKGEFHLRASENMADELVEVYRRMPIRLGEGVVGGSAARREPAQVPDIQRPEYQSRYRDLLIREGYRAILAVPLLREEQIIGALTVNRNEPGEFPPEIVELLKTFATQSALAIQNARLFREIAEKGRQLEEASRHKSDFLASMSHELRTPLNAILGFNEMILGQVYGEVPADMKEPLEDIQKSGKHLLRLINNVLDLAKIEAGRMELSVQEYSVQDAVEGVRATLRPLAAEKGLEFRASVPGDLPLARGDSGRITQCLMNLAGNSLKFTKAGKVEIAVTLEGDRLRFSVADTGIGIPADKIGGLFTEFKQTDAAIASEYGGTGLGLSITKKFIEMHGGRIWVDSEPARGSTFLFEVPLRVPA